MDEHQRRACVSDERAANPPDSLHSPPLRNPGDYNRRVLDRLDQRLCRPLNEDRLGLDPGDALHCERGIRE
jgi:hypothetical protein